MYMMFGILQKKLGKKVNKAGQSKESRELLDWNWTLLVFLLLRYRLG